MERCKLAVIAVTMAALPLFASLGCNKKEDLAPAPSATVVTVPPPASPPPPPPATPAVIPQPQSAPVKIAVRADAGARDGSVSVVALAFPDAAVVAIPQLPTIPNLQPSALPAIASGIVGGLVAATSGLIPPLPVPAGK